MQGVVRNSGEPAIAMEITTARVSTARSASPQQLRLRQRHSRRQPDCVDRHPGHLEILQDDLHLAAIDEAHQPERGEADPGAAGHGRVGRGGAVRPHAAVDLDQPAPAGDAERLGFGVAVGQADDAFVARQLVGVFRPPVPREVGRRTEHHGVKITQPPRFQRRIAHLPDTHRDVQAFGHEIDLAIGDLELDLEPWMARDQLGHHRDDVGRGKQHRTAHAQQARQLGLLACRLAAGIADLREAGFTRR